MAHADYAALVGKKLKSLIKTSSYRTQEKFAEAICVDPVTVRRWIKNGIKDINTIAEVASMFDLELVDILKD